MQARNIARVLKNIPTIEGAGVHLKRVFGNHQTPSFDPFLLLDDFNSRQVDQYVAGFPWHPHRGIETITYMLHGHIEHKDSLGHTGIISGGEVQWMTAGSGIIHQEMPAGESNGLLWGFQLWANLPAAHKMMAPRYQDISRDAIPDLLLPDGVNIKIICGEVNGIKGPVRDIIIDPQYLDVSLPADKLFVHPVPKGHTVFVYVIQGQARFGAEKKMVTTDHLALFTDGEMIQAGTENQNVRFLLIAGKPIGEPVAWYGPIVMNTQAELHTAFEEYRSGTFLKHPRPQ
jgi:redox-sensitive bicupin YhaK (pirin superfamily)